MDKTSKLIKLQQQYIKLLESALSDLSWVYATRSYIKPDPKKVKRGEQLRAKIKGLQAENLKKGMAKMSKDNMAKSLGQDVGLQITELTDEHLNLIYIGRKMVCEQDCNCHAECDKADEYIKQLKTSKQA